MLEPKEGYEAFDTGDEFGALFGAIYKKTVAGEAGSSTAVLAFRVSEHHLNPNGFCHGGAVSTFADLQIITVASQLQQGHNHHATKNLNVDFIAPIKLHAWVEMEGELIRVTKSTVYLHCVMKVDGRVVVGSTASYHVST